MFARRRGRLGLVLVAALALASVAAALAVIVPRVQHRRRLAAAVAAAELDLVLRSFYDTGPNLGGPPWSDLLAFDDPEVALVFLSVLRNHGAGGEGLRSAVEHLATTASAGDPRVLAGLAALAESPQADIRTRFQAAYLLEELNAPTFPAEPPGFADRSARVRFAQGNVGSAVAAIASVARPIDVAPSIAGLHVPPSPIEERPWRALLRVVRTAGLDWGLTSGAERPALEVADGRVRLVARPTVHFDPEWTEAVAAGDLAWTLQASIVLVPPADPTIPVERRVRASWSLFIDSRIHADPLKALRAFAAVHGRTVAAVGPGYELRRR